MLDFHKLIRLDSALYHIIFSGGNPNNDSQSKLPILYNIPTFSLCYNPPPIELDNSYCCIPKGFHLVLYECTPHNSLHLHNSSPLVVVDVTLIYNSILALDFGGYCSYQNFMLVFYACS